MIFVYLYAEGNIMIKKETSDLTVREVSWSLASWISETFGQCSWKNGILAGQAELSRAFRRAPRTRQWWAAFCYSLPPVHFTFSHLPLSINFPLCNGNNITEKSSLCPYSPDTALASGMVREDRLGRGRRCGRRSFRDGGSLSGSAGRKF